MEAELLAEDLQIARLRIVNIEPEELTGGDQLAHPVALEVEAPVDTAVQDVVGASSLRWWIHSSIVCPAPEATSS